MPSSKRGAQAAAMRGEKLLLSRSKYGRPSLAAPPSCVSIKPQSAVGTPRQHHLIPALEPGPEAAVETGIHGNRNDLDCRLSPTAEWRSCIAGRASGSSDG